MSTELATRAVILKLPKARGLTVALQLAPELSRDDWEVLGQALVRYGNASSWWIGDWLAHGDWEWGEMYDRAIELTGLDYQTLANYKLVAERFDISRRQEKLSWSHHLEVVGLTPLEQDSWLIRAESEGLSVADLREALRASRAPAPQQTTITLEQIRFTVPPERAERWKQAADRAEQDFSEWAATVLDQAAA